MNKYKIYMVNLGCPKNLVDGETMLMKLLKSQYEIVSSYKQAQIVLVNTCGFIDAAKNESIDTIMEYAYKWKKKSKDKFLIVTGCVVGRYKEKLLKLMPEVDGWLAPGEIDKIESLVNNVLKTKQKEILFTKKPKSFLQDKDEFGEFFYKIKPAQKKFFTSGKTHSAYIKIADGCDNLCTYCIIPAIRGPYKSRTIESITQEIENLVSSNVKEINLIAQDITNFGTDNYGSKKLTQLIKPLLKIKNLNWVRLLYSYPERITPELIELIKNENKICKYLDMPTQHIDSKILKVMNRKSSEKSIRNIVEAIKNNIPNIALRTSLIVGFPQETDKQFEKLVDWIREVEFDYLGVFTYSREEGTKAYSMSGQIPQKIKEERQQELLKIQSEIVHKKNMLKVDKIYNVLIEELLGNQLKGRAEFQAPEIDGEIIIENGKAELGEYKKVKIINAIEYNLYGDIV